MNTRRIATIITTGLIAVAGLAGCGEEDVEDAARDAGNTAEDVGNEAKDEAGEVGNSIENEVEE